MTRVKKYFKNLSITRQFFLARIIYDWSIFIFDSFYLTYVFKESGEVKDVVINMLISFGMTYLGFILGSLYMRKAGAEANLKRSFVLFIITGIVGMFLSTSGVASFVIISVLRGLAEGYYWASVNFIELAGLPSHSRSKYYSVSQAVNHVFYIAAPIAIGYVLTQVGNLLPVYILFTVFCLVGIFVPFDFKSNHKIAIRKKNFKKLLHHPRLKEFVVVKTMASIMWMIDWLMASVIAFVVLGNELNMGVFMAVSSVLSVIIALVTRNFAVREKTTAGFVANLVSSISLLFFAAHLNSLWLYLNEIVRAVTGAVSSPAEFDLSIRVSNELVGDDNLGAEVNIFQEGVFTIARFIFGGVFLLIYPFFTSTAVVLAVLIGLFVITRIVHYLLSTRFLGLKMINFAKEELEDEEEELLEEEEEYLIS